MCWWDVKPYSISHHTEHDEVVKNVVFKYLVSNVALNKKSAQIFQDESIKHQEQWQYSTNMKEPS